MHRCYGHIFCKCLLTFDRRRGRRRGSHRRGWAHLWTADDANGRDSRGRASSTLPAVSFASKLIDRWRWQVASYLKPIDLLHLARVSSAFRNMLLSHSSRRIWAKARKNVVPEVPDGPHDLSEPLYARLLFERICMVGSQALQRTFPINTSMHAEMRIFKCKSRRLCERTPIL